jgi:hypothetical protein
MRYMQEMGLNLENCERWIERALFAVLTVLFVIMIIRVSYHSIIDYTMVIKFFELPAAFPSCSITLLHSLDKELSTWSSIIRIIEFYALARNATYLPPSQEYHRSR